MVTPVTLLIATLLGFLTGLGTGGGSLLILWLTMALDMAPGDARIINLLFFLPAALISCLFRWRQGKLELKKVLPAILAGCATAGAMSVLSHRLDLPLLKKLFGILLLATGLRELFYRPRKAK